MSKQFIKKEELVLKNGGYLVTKSGDPVNNDAFVNAQRHAEYVVTFASMAKDKDFNGKEADSLTKFKKEVNEVLYTAKVKEYVSKPKTPSNTTNEKLQKEAVAFMNYHEDISKNEKINAFLNNFNVINEFEEFGLFFEQDIVKLNKIYTMDEIVKAVTSVIELLD